MDEDRARSLEDAVSLYQGDLLEGCYEDWCIYERERLPIDVIFEGPAIIEEDGSTTVVLPGWRARRDATGNLRLSAIR